MRMSQMDNADELQRRRTSLTANTTGNASSSASASAGNHRFAFSRSSPQFHRARTITPDVRQAEGSPASFNASSNAFALNPPSFQFHGAIETIPVVRHAGSTGGNPASPSANLGYRGFAFRRPVSQFRGARRAKQNGGQAGNEGGNAPFANACSSSFAFNASSSQIQASPEANPWRKMMDRLNGRQAMNNANAPPAFSTNAFSKPLLSNPPSFQTITAPGVTPGGSQAGNTLGNGASSSANANSSPIAWNPPPFQLREALRAIPGTRQAENTVWDPNSSHANEGFNEYDSIETSFQRGRTRRTAPRDRQSEITAGNTSMSSANDGTNPLFIPPPFQFSGTAEAKPVARQAWNQSTDRVSPCGNAGSNVFAFNTPSFGDDGAMQHGRQREITDCWNQESSSANANFNEFEFNAPSWQIEGGPGAIPYSRNERNPGGKISEGLESFAKACSNILSNSSQHTFQFQGAPGKIQYGKPAANTTGNQDASTTNSRINEFEFMAPSFKMDGFPGAIPQVRQKNRYTSRQTGTFSALPRDVQEGNTAMNTSIPSANASPDDLVFTPTPFQFRETPGRLSLSRQYFNAIGNPYPYNSNEFPINPLSLQTHGVTGATQYDRPEADTGFYQAPPNVHAVLHELESTLRSLSTDGDRGDERPAGNRPISSANDRSAGLSSNIDSSRISGTSGAEALDRNAGSTYGNRSMSSANDRYAGLVFNIDSSQIPGTSLDRSAGSKYGNRSMYCAKERSTGFDFEPPSQRTHGAPGAMQYERPDSSSGSWQASPAANSSLSKLESSLHYLDKARNLDRRSPLNRPMSSSNESSSFQIPRISEAEPFKRNAGSTYGNRSMYSANERSTVFAFDPNSQRTHEPQGAMQYERPESYTDCYQAHSSSNARLNKLISFLHSWNNRDDKLAGKTAGNRPTYSANESSTGLDLSNPTSQIPRTSGAEPSGGQAKRSALNTTMSSANACSRGFPHKPTSFQFQGPPRAIPRGMQAQNATENSSISSANACSYESTFIPPPFQFRRAPAGRPIGRHALETPRNPEASPACAYSRGLAVNPTSFNGVPEAMKYSSQAGKAGLSPFNAKLNEFKFNHTPSQIEAVPIARARCGQAGKTAGKISTFSDRPGFSGYTFIPNSEVPEPRPTGLSFNPNYITLEGAQGVRSSLRQASNIAGNTPTASANGNYKGVSLKKPSFQFSRTPGAKQHGRQTWNPEVHVSSAKIGFDEFESIAPPLPFREAPGAIPFGREARRTPENTVSYPESTSGFAFSPPLLQIHDAPGATQYGKQARNTPGNTSMASANPGSHGFAFYPTSSQIIETPSALQYPRGSTNKVGDISISSTNAGSSESTFNPSSFQIPKTPGALHYPRLATNTFGDTHMSSPSPFAFNPTSSQIFVAPTTKANTREAEITARKPSSSSANSMSNGLALNSRSFRILRARRPKSNALRKARNIVGDQEPCSTNAGVDEFESITPPLQFREAPRVTSSGEQAWNTPGNIPSLSSANACSTGFSSTAPSFQFQGSPITMEHGNQSANAVWNPGSSFHNASFNEFEAIAPSCQIGGVQEAETSGRQSMVGNSAVSPSASPSPNRLAFIPRSFQINKMRGPTLSGSSQEGNGAGNNTSMSSAHGSAGTEFSFQFRGATRAVSPEQQEKGTDDSTNGSMDGSTDDNTSTTSDGSSCHDSEYMDFSFSKRGAPGAMPDGRPARRNTPWNTFMSSAKAVPTGFKFDSLSLKVPVAQGTKSDGSQAKSNTFISVLSPANASVSPFVFRVPSSQSDVAPGEATGGHQEGNTSGYVASSSANPSVSPFVFRVPSSQSDVAPGEATGGHQEGNTSGYVASSSANASVSPFVFRVPSSQSDVAPGEATGDHQEGNTSGYVASSSANASVSPFVFRVPSSQSDVAPGEATGDHQEGNTSGYVASSSANASVSPFVFRVPSSQSDVAPRETPSGKKEWSASDKAIASPANVACSRFVFTPPSLANDGPPNEKQEGNMAGNPASSSLDTSPRLFAATPTSYQIQCTEAVTTDGRQAGDTDQITASSSSENASSSVFDFFNRLSSWFDGDEGAIPKDQREGKKVGGTPVSPGYSGIAFNSSPFQSNGSPVAANPTNNPKFKCRQAGDTAVITAASSDNSSAFTFNLPPFQCNGSPEAIPDGGSEWSDKAGKTVSSSDNSTPCRFSHSPLSFQADGGNPGVISDGGIQAETTSGKTETPPSKSAGSSECILNPLSLQVHQTSSESKEACVEADRPRGGLPEPD